MTTRLLRRALGLLGGLLFFFTVWLLWPRELDGSSFSHDGKSSVPDYAMTNAHYVSVKAGHLEMETRAREASFDMSSHRMEARNVVALLYDAQGARTIVTAEKADFHMGERVLQLRDNVNALSPDGFLLRSEEGSYLVQKRLLTTKVPVQGETLEKEVQVWGDSAEAPLDEHKVFLRGNARALFQERKRGPTRVRGESAVLDRVAEKVTFRSRVRVEQEKVVGTSGEADLYYSHPARSVRYMSMRDDVRIEQGDGKHTRSQVAEFFAPTDTIVLSGFPAVYDGDSAVTGDKITLYRATGVAEVLATNAAGAAPSRAQGKGGGAEPVPEIQKEDEELIP